MKNIVVAYSNNRVIGNEGALPWDGQMPADMKRFRGITLDKTVIMGRKTLESIGQLLPRRQNIVVTRMAECAIEGVIIANSLEEAYDLAEHEICVIGGGQLYKEAISSVELIHATEIDVDVVGDAYFPNLDPEQWHEVDRTEYPADNKNSFDYSFVTYSKI